VTARAIRHLKLLARTGQPFIWVLESKGLDLLPKNHGIAGTNYSKPASGRISVLGPRRNSGRRWATEPEVFRLINRSHIGSCRGFLLDWRSPPSPRRCRRRSSMRGSPRNWPKHGIPRSTSKLAHKVPVC